MSSKSGGSAAPHAARKTTMGVLLSAWLCLVFVRLSQLCGKLINSRSMMTVLESDLVANASSLSYPPSLERALANHTEAFVASRSAASAAPTAENVSRYNRTLSLVVRGRGELGNHLGLLGNAQVIQQFVESKLPGVRIKMVFEHQAGRKWKLPQRDLRQCFTNFRQFQTDGGSWDPQFKPFHNKQDKWLGKSGTTMLDNVHTDKQVVYLQSLLDKQTNGTAGGVPSAESSGSKYSMPFLTTQSFLHIAPPLFRDEAFPPLYAKLRSTFRFDADACCRERAQPDEIVFHFRNFITELRRVDKAVESSPNEAADMLVASVRNSTNLRQRFTKVAIMSRFAETAKPYVAAFESRGFETRIISGQSGVQDFCFAMSAAYLVGSARSHYVGWAGLLGNASLVQWYTVNTDPSSPPGNLLKNNTVSTAK